MAKKRIAVLGCTGSVGRSALRIIQDRTDRFQVVALAARSSAAELAAAAARFRPAAVSLVEPGTRPPELPAGTEFFGGEGGLLTCLDRAEPDLVLNGITGAAGLPASEWTLRHGRTLALAWRRGSARRGSLVRIAATMRAALTSTF